MSGRKAHISHHQTFAASRPVAHPRSIPFERIVHPRLARQSHAAVWPSPEPRPASRRDCLGYRFTSISVTVAASRRPLPDGAAGLSLHCALRDHGGLGPASELSELRDGEGDVGDGLDDVEGLHLQVARWRLVLLEVHADRRAIDACAGEAEDEARAVRKDEAHALVLGDGAVDRVVVAKHVRLVDGHAAVGGPDEVGLRLDHGVDHILGRLLVNGLVVVARVVVATELLPVHRAHVGDADERLGGVAVLRCEDLQPCEHGPHAVLLADVVTSRAEGLLAADEGRVDGRAGVGGRARVHQVPEELPAGGHLEKGDAELLSHEVEGA
mmetsp:Transcript_7455/g.16336  ORF Transcript_7455/g.16336 Transcript_7455/m.16336 type:complete len:326 (+) Transcript_7455:280-1257(+)